MFHYSLDTNVKSKSIAEYKVINCILNVGTYIVFFRKYSELITPIGI